jgi:outer membrane protein OmpA-like peptidoglycan-associated protein
MLALLAPVALAQQPAPPVVSPAAAPVDLRFVGDTYRLGIGYDSENGLAGEALLVFGETARSAWIGEVWASASSAGGAKVSYQWQPEGGGADAAVRKFFLAADQNDWHDRKITLGGGFENPEWFAAGYVSTAITGRRQTDLTASSSAQTIFGVDGGRPFEQVITTTLTTRTWERAWDHGVGLRAGRHYEGPQLRLTAGGDYEWGKGNASQATLSLGVEKFFAGTPHSIGVVGEFLRKRGDLETGGDDARVVAMYRYSFGGTAWKPATQVRRVPVEVPAATTSPATVASAASSATTSAPPAPRVERRLVKTTASATADALFDLDRSVLRPDAKAALDAVAARLSVTPHEGNVRVTGHTCDLGPDAYNLKLSQRRAVAVRDHLVAAGLPASRIVVEGMGESAPRYPNDAAGRPKNRRVDIEFVTVVEREEAVTLPPAAAGPAAPPAAPARPAPRVEWREEVVTAEPAWLRRALVSPTAHKRSVDVYRTQQTTTAVSEGPKQYLNRPPAPVADAYSVDENSSANSFDVLANDNDADGDPLSIVGASTPAHGTASVAGGRILYTPAPGYAGPDAFTYTAADGRGGTGSASVAVTVVRRNRPPVAKSDYAETGYQTPTTIDVLANDSDPDGDPLSIVSFSPPASGSARITRGPNNTLIYQATNGYVGFDGFTYTISDGKGGTATAEVLVFADP